jgi:hypothetical protein
VIDLYLKVLTPFYQRQVYSDYAICQAAKYRMQDKNSKIKWLLLIYDIACQWWINFYKRLKLCPGLSFDQLLNVLVAVGKFHLASHVTKCFWKYSLSLMKGAGLLDGEIMETVWSKFNSMAITARAMSLAYRREILNHFLRDHNFKKMISMRKWIVLSLNRRLMLSRFHPGFQTEKNKGNP